MKDMMQHFTISEAAVRKQLQDLWRLDFVRKKTVKRSIGRPHHVYTLTHKGDQTFPDQYDVLPVELLKDLEVSQGAQAVDQLLETRKKREKQEMMTDLENDRATSFKDRVQALFALKEDEGYMIELLEQANGDMDIVNYNCPILKLAANFDVICDHEQEIFHDIFEGSQVWSHACMTKGDHYCAWTITHPINRYEKKENRF